MPPSLSKNNYSVSDGKNLVVLGLKTQYKNSSEENKMAPRRRRDGPVGLPGSSIATVSHAIRRPKKCMDVIVEAGSTCRACVKAFILPAGESLCISM